MRYKMMLRSNLRYKEQKEKKETGGKIKGKAYFVTMPEEPVIPKKVVEELKGEKGVMQQKLADNERRKKDIFVLESLEMKGEKVIWEEQTRELYD